MSVQCSEIVSVIVPTRDEADSLNATLETVFDPGAEYETLVVDGGSKDATTEVAGAAGARVIVADRPQRAAQMNLGARAARGDIFLFLHADTRLPSGALPAVRRALLDPRVVGGAFARRYDSRSLVLAVTCLLAESRNRLFGWHLGDQAMFVRRKIFEEIGGFAAIDIFEDLDFSRRMARAGRIVTLRPRVISSARRFASAGAVRRTWLDLLLTCRYIAASAAGEVASGKIRSHRLPFRA